MFFKKSPWGGKGGSIGKHIELTNRRKEKEMVKIISQQGYPQDGELLVHVDYFIKERPCEGGILIVGKDGQGIEYRPKSVPISRGSYRLPSGAQYSVAVGDNPEKDYPAIFFPFELTCSLSSAEVAAKADANEDFFDALDMKVMDESREPIVLEESLVKLFKFFGTWAVLDLADATVQSAIRNHFWGEMYIPRAPDIESLLEQYRNGK